jgi:hypothetical protein
MRQKNELSAQEIERLKEEFQARGGKVQVGNPVGFPRHVRRGFGAVILEGERK